MSGDCDLCGSYDHVETRCPSTRLNDQFGCVRCGQIGCEWANGVGTQHRAIAMTYRHEGCDRRIATLEAEVERLRSLLQVTLRHMEAADDLVGLGKLAIASLEGKQ